MNTRLTALAFFALAGCSDESCRPDVQAIAYHEAQSLNAAGYLGGLKNNAVNWKFEPGVTRQSEIDRIEAVIRRHQIEIDYLTAPCAASRSL